MAVRKFNPVTPGQRHKIIGTFESITATSPEKSLVSGMKKTGGRNKRGKNTKGFLQRLKLSNTILTVPQESPCSFMLMAKNATF